MKITGHKKQLFVTILLVLFTFLPAHTATAQTPIPGTKLTAGLDAMQAGAWFGQAVAISDTVMVVGAPPEDVTDPVSQKSNTNAGSAYALTHDGTGWDKAEKIIASTSPKPFAYFGQSVATNGNLVVVGAPTEAVIDPVSRQVITDAGSAYVFTHDGTGWDKAEKIIASTSPKPFAYFGQSVATNGNLVVVGAPFAQSAYVFTNDTTGWVGEALPSPPTSALFGWSVATDGIRIVVGDPAASSVYVFTKNETGWEYQEISFIQAIWFGSSVSISGDTVAVGAPSDLPFQPSLSPEIPGSAYVFAYDQDRSAWDQTPQATLALAAAGFGTSVSISGDLLVVSAPMDNVDESKQAMATLRAGAVYIFKRQVNGNQTQWVELEEQPKVTALDDVSPDATEEDRFGWSVYIDGHTLAVGSPLKDADGATESGAAYVYTLPSSNHRPVANAGADQEVVEGSPVVLDGSASTDPDGDELTLAWVQIEGPKVELSDRAAREPLFIAPEPTNSCAFLTFQLTATDDEGLISEPADVQVKVLPYNKIYGKLGGKHRSWLHWHKYSFYGHQDDPVHIRLEADPDGWDPSDKATLILKDKIKGTRLFEKNMGSLPIEVSATLPADGEYAVYVLKQPGSWSWWRHKSFEGNYILTLDGTCGKLGTSRRFKKR